MKGASLRRRLYVQLDPAAWPHRGLSPLTIALVGAILLAILVSILETEPLITRGREEVFQTVELGFGLVFLGEYLGRVWTIVEDGSGESRMRRRLRFVASPAALFDLFVIVATLAPFVGLNAAVLRLFRVLRILRIAKLGRISAAISHVVFAVKSRRYELLLTLGLALAILVLSATALYWVEGDLQPDKFGSIPRAMWWAVVTLTTIGYGDVYPITPVGKFIAAIAAVAGIGLIALPAGILASAFSEATKRSNAPSE